MNKAFQYIIYALSVMSIFSSPALFADKLDSSPKELFKMFHRIYEKKYNINSEEAILKYKIFKKNLDKIKSVPKDATYTLGVNEFADEDDDVPMKIVEGGNNILVKEDKTQYPAVDFRNLICTPLASVSGCTSYGVLGWASAIEAFINKASGTASICVSPQSLIDCFGTNGCSQFTTFNDNFLTLPAYYSTSVYKYTGTQGSCQSPGSPLASPSMYKYISSWTNYYNVDIQTLMNALANGPLTFSTAFTLPSTFTGGLYVPSGGSASCGSYYYSLLLVGYGTDSASGSNYWIVKGNKGATWGEKGYIRVTRNDNYVNYGISCGFAGPSN